jgi:PAS domain S-box-containing protein
MDKMDLYLDKNRFASGSSEELYHMMIEEVEDYAILMLDSHGLVRNWNKGAEKIKGYKESEIVGRHFRVFYPQVDQEGGLPEKLMGEAQRAGKATHEGWRIRKDGSSFWGSVVITALHDAAGHVIGFTKVTRDLTERKMAEDQVIRNSRLSEMQNKELQQFANAAAHDMKEPLRKILFYCSSIEDEGMASFSDKQRTYLQRTSEAAQRMHRLIEDLLSFTRVAQPNNEMEEVDLNGIITEVIAFFQDGLDKVDGSVVVSALPVIMGIRLQIWQLFVNLLSNSIKYHQTGRPLVVEITGKEVANQGLSDYAPRPYLQIQIKDNGIGFAPIHEETVFNMFERLHGRAAFEGSGVGLAICRRVMQNHKGYIRAEGKPGEGAVFTMFFPLG